MGVMAIFFIVKGDFFTAIVLAWIGGAFDILDGKLARRYNLSTEFGIQLDSFADFLIFCGDAGIFTFLRSQSKYLRYFRYR